MILSSYDHIWFFQPLTPTDAKPDLSKLRLIRESELRRGGIIGSGAFGTVYKVKIIENYTELKLIMKKCHLRKNLIS
jgi:hypothetical protein